jgi:hypothetical protein
MELSRAAQQELAVYKQTKEVNTAGALYNEVYEYYANSMSVSTRTRPARQFTYCLRRINKL